MSHHVAVRLPDGRDAWADYRQPVVHVMRRILAQRAEGKDGSDEDYALVTAWLDRCPELACPPGCTDVGAAHPPASSEPFTPPRYLP